MSCRPNSYRNYESFTAVLFMSFGNKYGDSSHFEWKLKVLTFLKTYFSETKNQLVAATKTFGLLLEINKLDASSNSLNKSHVVAELMKLRLNNSHVIRYVLTNNHTRSSNYQHFVAQVHIE